MSRENYFYIGVVAFSIILFFFSQRDNRVSAAGTCLLGVAEGGLCSAYVKQDNCSGGSPGAYCDWNSCIEIGQVGCWQNKPLKEGDEYSSTAKYSCKCKSSSTPTPSSSQPPTSTPTKTPPPTPTPFSAALHLRTDITETWQGSLTLTAPVAKIVDLRGTANNGSGNIDYYFWCNENDATLDFNNYNAKKSTGTSPWKEKDLCGDTYSTPGTYYPKVVIERNGIRAENRKPITVTGTLGATLVADKTSGTSPLSVILTEGATGTQTGTINYSLWWDCTDTTNSVQTANTSCGTLATPPAGTCLITPNVGYKCDAITANPTTAPAHSYTTGADPTIYIPKVIVERGNASPAQKQVSVTVNPNQGPTVAVIGVDHDRCFSGKHSFLTWDYDDPELDAENAYQVIVKQGGATFWDSGKVEPSYGAQSLQLLPYLAYGSTYTATVQAWDTNDNASNIASSLPFTTLEHDKPRPNFTWPTPAKVGKPVQFTDTTVYDGGAPYSYAWNFACSGKCTPGTSSDQNPISTFFQSGNYSVNLAVADNDTGLPICSVSKSVNIGGSYIPIWREIAPF
ncbi:MAG: PKD domain-containing protein [Patescibacteria group bacterium]